MEARASWLLRRSRLRDQQHLGGDRSANMFLLQRSGTNLNREYRWEEGSRALECYRRWKIPVALNCCPMLMQGVWFHHPRHIWPEQWLPSWYLSRRHIRRQRNYWIRYWLPVGVHHELVEYFLLRMTEALLICAGERRMSPLHRSGSENSFRMLHWQRTQSRNAFWIWWRVVEWEEWRLQWWRKYFRWLPSSWKERYWLETPC